MGTGQDFKAQFKKRLYAFTLRLIEFIDKLPSNDLVAKRLADQLLRSGTSVIGNYIEGQAASRKRDFTNYFNTALKSGNESKLWLCLIRDSNRCQPDDMKWLLDELTEICNILATSILTLKGRN